MQININKIKGSALEIEGSVPWPDFEKYEKKALRKLGADMALPGFRPGHVPEEALKKNIPDGAILDEMAQEFFSENYPRILAENKIDAIGHPEVTLTKLARGNPFEFKLSTAVLPEIELADYKKIASATEKTAAAEATDEEVEKTILQLRQMRAPKIKHEGCEDKICEHTGELPAVSEVELPELNDDFVKSLGDFSNVPDFKQKLKANIGLEKENKEREKRRIKIIENIVKESRIDLPDLLIQIELDKMLARLKFDAEQAKVKFEDYLKQVNKTEDDLKKEWRLGAAERVKAELVIGEIAKAEKISPEEAQIEGELARLLEFYKGADPLRARAHVENIMKNEKVFQLLESQ